MKNWIRNIGYLSDLKKAVKSDKNSERLGRKE